MSRLRTAFVEALRERKMPREEFARLAGVRQSTITKFIHGSVPQDTLFRAIFKNWADAETRRRLLRAHIADEVERAGMRLEDFDAQVATLDEGLEKDLATLEVAMRAEPTLREFIRRTAAIFAEGK